MKLKTLPLIVIVLAMAIATFPQAKTRYVVTVKGLACPFCAYGLEKKLKKIEGVESVSIDLEKGRATLVVKPGASVTEKEIREAVGKAGFSVDSVEKVETETSDRRWTGAAVRR